MRKDDGAIGSERIEANRYEKTGALGRYEDKRSRQVELR
jgi:hypothetical protein